ncbi:MAG: LytTR family DNA-binding domain-containing protein [Bacillota bacterium]
MSGTWSFNALLVDDEEPARDELKHLLRAYPACVVCGEAGSGRTALEMAVCLQPDVVFLDIHMRGLTGCEAARRMLALPRPPLIVFVTAYDRYAVEAFELGAVDYLLKPFGAERLAQTMARLQSMLGNPLWRQLAVRQTAGVFDCLPPPGGGVASPPEQAAGRTGLNKLPAEKGGRITLIDYQEIVFARSSGGATRVSTLDGCYDFPGTLCELTERLGKDGSFLRIHKSYLVNLQHIKEVLPWFKGTYWVIMADREKTQIPVSKTQVKALKKILGLA